MAIEWLVLTLVVTTATHGTGASTDVTATATDVTTLAASTIDVDTTAVADTTTSPEATSGPEVTTTAATRDAPTEGTTVPEGAAATTIVPGETATADTTPNGITTALPEGPTTPSSDVTTSSASTDVPDEATTVPSVDVTTPVNGVSEDTTAPAIDTTTTDIVTDVPVETTSTPSDADTEATTQADLTTTAATTVTTESNQGACTVATFPDVLGLSECLGNSLNLCTEENTMREGMMKLTSCTATSVFRNLTPQAALRSLRVILVAFVSKLSPFLGKALDSFLARLRPSGSVVDPVCRGEIKMGFPSSYGKCLNDTLKLCKNGSTIDVSFLQSLTAANMCFMREALTTSPLDRTRAFFCNILRGTKAVFGNVFLIGPIMYDQLMSGTCRVM